MNYYNGIPITQRFQRSNNVIPIIIYHDKQEWSDKKGEGEGKNAC